MPLSYSRSFRVRYYECDAHGHLNNANYLRYMQETAFDASTEGGYDWQRYKAMERAWTIRETQIEHIKPVHHNDTITIHTWIGDFRRVSSRRLYAFHNADSNEVVARAYTDWVFLNSSTGRPTAIPKELRSSFFPDGIPATFPSRQPFPKAPQPPSGVFTTRQRVAWSDIDSMNHVNNAVYLNYITECGMQALASHNWPWDRMRAAGFGIYLRRNQIRYLQPALLDDELEIATWVSNIRRATANRYYMIRRIPGNTLLAQAQSWSVWVDLASGQPIRIPKDFLDDFAANIVT